MTTLAVNKIRTYEGAPIRDEENAIPVIASDIIYEGAAVGVVDATGHARPLNAADRFAGFAMVQADNSLGAAAAINVTVRQQGFVQLPVTGAVITDLGQPVYATDDDAFGFTPVAAAFIGFVHRFVSAGVAIVAFDALNYRDPWAAYTVRELSGATLTLDIEDQGKLIVADTDNTVISLAAVATPSNCVIMNIGAFGTVKLSLSPVAADKVQGPNLPGTDNTDHTNTKATQRRGDFIKIATGDANGPFVIEQRGIWATAN